MKLHYFGQQQADDDDRLLAWGKRSGDIPKNCLCSGAVVRLRCLAGQHPCEQCNAPRAKCGGAQKIDDDDRARLAYIRGLIVGPSNILPLS